MFIKANAIFIITLLYAIARYIIFGDVSWNQLPSFIINKAIAWSAVIFLVITGFNFLKKEHNHTKIWGRLAFHFALLHIIISVGLFSSDYYPKFFSGNLLTFLGELMILTGGIAIYSLHRIKEHKKINTHSIRFELLGIVAVGLHLFSMGIPGWFQPIQWYAGLPPISLLSFVLIITAGIFYIIPKRQKRNNL